jgi:hypothetical protein
MLLSEYGFKERALNIFYNEFLYFFVAFLFIGVLREGVRKNSIYTPLEFFFGSIISFFRIL